MLFVILSPCFCLTLTIIQLGRDDGLQSAGNSDARSRLDVIIYASHNMFRRHATSLVSFIYAGYAEDWSRRSSPRQVIALQAIRLLAARR